eukprot:8590373-Pyramimonas_sp.AAC.1
MKPSWGRVRSPAGAVIMSMTRASWTWPAWHMLCTEHGLSLDMRVACRIHLVDMVKEDVQAKLWEES